MLKSLFDPYASDHEISMCKEAMSVIARFTRKLRKTYGHDKVDARWIRLDLWANGLIVALDELEQSVYCSRKFAEHLDYRYEEEMTESDRLDYYRHLYFYKNAVIRIFSILDKTGFFLDTLFDLETAKVKSKFSYFTVLRQMHQRSVHTHLEQQLYNLKLKFREPLDRLRRKRNLEIHAMNAELIDDVWRSRQRFADRMEVEPIAENHHELMQGFEKVCLALQIIFSYCENQIRR